MARLHMYTPAESSGLHAAIRLHVPNSLVYVPRWKTCMIDCDQQGFCRGTDVKHPFFMLNASEREREQDRDPA